MLKKIIESIKQLNRTPVAVDPAQFEDAVANSTSWSPAKSGGQNFCSHKLVEAAVHRMEFRATLGAKLFGMVFVLGGLVPIGWGCYNIVAGEEASLDFKVIFLFLFGLVFAGVGVGLLYFFTKPIVFDKHSGHFWKGKTDPNWGFIKDALKVWAPLEQIHALQLIAEHCTSDKSSYYSYELNLVLKDGERINVVDHGKLNKIREDANKLSSFLEKPVWDAI